MADLTESTTYTSVVPSITTADDVIGSTGGAPNDGVANQPHIALANRTKWLKAQLTVLQATVNSNVAQITTNIADIAALDSAKFDKAGGTVTGNTTFTGGLLVEIDGAGVLSFTDTAYIINSGSGDIMHVGAGNIEHAGAGDIEHSGSGNIKISGSGKFEGDGSLLDSMTLRNSIDIDFGSMTADHASTYVPISTTTAPKLSKTAAAGVYMYPQWVYPTMPADGTDYLGFRMRVPKDYNGGGVFKLVVKSSVAGGTTPSCTIDAQAVDLGSLHGAGAGATTDFDAVTLTDDDTDRAYTLSITSGSNELVADGSIEVKIWPVVTGTPTVHTTNLEMIKFEYTPVHG